MNIEMILSGFFFWFIIVTNFASDLFGYSTFNDPSAETKLQRIGKNPKKFKIGFTIILIEHAGIIVLAFLLFAAFSPVSIVLALIWTTSRTLEALIQIYYKKEYWVLLDLAKKYGNSKAPEKQKIINSGQAILNRKQFSFLSAQILFSIGTFSYSILFVTTGIVPVWIGWAGIAAAVTYGIGNGIVLLKPGIKAVWNMGGLLVLPFELILGGWLLFFSH